MTSIPTAVPRSSSPFARPLVRRLLLVAMALLVVAAGPLAPAFAQSDAAPMRIVVVPFEADAGTGPYGAGLAAALQRALNTIDGVYAPPLGDTLVIRQRAADAGADPDATLQRFLSPDHVVTGRVGIEGSALTLGLELDGEPLEVRARGSSSPALAQAFGTALLDRLFSDRRAGEQNAFLDVLGATPSAPSLGAATLSAALLPGVALEDLEAASQLDEGSSWVHAEFARQLARDGQLERAADEADRAVTLNPNDIEARLVLAAVQQSAGDLEAATATFRAASTLNPAHPRALVGLAQLDPDRRRARLEAAIQANPRYLEAYLLLAQLEPTAQDEVRVLRRGASALLDSSAYHREVVAAILAAGDARGALNYLRDTARQPLAQSSGLYALAGALPPSLSDEAAAFVAQGRERFPEAGELLVVDAQIALDRNDVDAAISLLQQRLDQAPDDAEALNALAVAYARQGDIDAASRTAERIRSGTLASRLNLALIYLEAGRASSALDVTTSLLDDVGGPDQASATLLAAHGLAQALTGDADGGRATLELAAERDPSATLPARALEQLSQRERLGVEAVEIDPGARPAFDRGMFALNQGDYAGAAAAFADARAVADAGILAYYHGLALLRSGDARSAVPAYEAALEGLGASQRPTVLGNLGFAHLQLGRYDLALDELRNSIELDDGVPQVHVTLGLTYYGLGRYADALASFERAIELDPSLSDQLAQVVSEAQRRTPQ